MQNISFKGIYLKPVNIKKLSSNGQYKPFQASFIELTHDDIDILRKVSKEWENSKNSKMTFRIQETSLLAPDIIKRKMGDFLHLATKIKKEDILAFLSANVLGKHLYAISTQKDNFNILNNEEILALIDINAKPDKNELEQIHVRPDCISEKYGKSLFKFLRYFIRNKGNEEKRPYSHIGNAAITTIQDMYNNKPLELTSLNSARGFYERYGFHHNFLSDIEYTWTPKATKTNF